MGLPFPGLGREEIGRGRCKYGCHSCLIYIAESLQNQVHHRARKKCLKELTSQNGSAIIRESCGYSSVVERNLAKVDVARSTRVTRLTISHPEKLISRGDCFD
jgi:hypothetical protein